MGDTCLAPAGRQGCGRPPRPEAGRLSLIRRLSTFFSRADNHASLRLHCILHLSIRHALLACTFPQYRAMSSGNHEQALQQLQTEVNRIVCRVSPESPPSTANFPVSSNKPVEYLQRPMARQKVLRKPR